MAKSSFPAFRAASPEHIRQIDRTGRRILARVGIRIKDIAFLNLLKEAGANVDYSNQMARFEEDWLDEIIRRAPSRFTLFSRNGKNDLALGEGRVHFACGGRVFRILDTATDSYRLTVLNDVDRTARLVDGLENIRLYIIACQSHDLEPRYYHLNDFFHAFNNTTKHVMGGCDNLEGVEQVWKLACLISGGEKKLRARPFFSVIINPISPLTIETNTLNILNFCARHSIPVTFTPAPMAGATSPASLAGTLAQMHAEALAGVAISQVIAPGAKVLYGALPTTMDLRNMEFTMGSVETAMMGASAVELARLYNLPIRTAAGVTEAKSPDIQSGIEKSLSNLMLAMAGADCISMAAGMLDSGNSIALEQYVIDNEIIGMIYRALSGIKVSKETLGFGVVERVGPGGHYVMEDHTVEHMMHEFFYPKLCIRSNFDVWEERGRPGMLSRAGDMVQTMLKGERREKPLSADLIAKIMKSFPGIKNF
jgi:trimethylamine--corrinoid protein Co-methyltransferase